MKKVLLMSLCFLCAVTAFTNDRESENEKTKWFIGPSVGVSWGEFGEYLYDSSDTYVCSKLLWEAKPLYNVGLSAGVERGKFLFEISQDFSLPLSCGKMYDSDWNKDGVKHTYSIFENNDNQFAFNTSITSQYKINISKYFFLKPLLQFEYRYNHFEAKNGFGYFGNKNFTNLENDIHWYDEKSLKAKVSKIEYVNHLFNASLGLNFVYKIQKHELNTIFFISPFTYIYTVDNHKDDKNLNRDFSNKMFQYGFLKNFKFIINYFYVINEKIKINSNFSIDYLQMTKGVTYTNNINYQWRKTNQKSGCDFQEFKISIGLLFYK